MNRWEPRERILAPSAFSNSTLGAVSDGPEMLKELDRLKKEYEVPAIVYKSHKEIQADKKKGR